MFYVSDSVRNGSEIWVSFVFWKVWLLLLRLTINKHFQIKQKVCVPPKHKTKHKNNNNNTNNYNSYIQSQHTNRSLQNNIPHPKYTPNIQIHPLHNNIHVSKVHSKSAFEPGASGLPCYCTSICVRSCFNWRASCVDTKTKQNKIQRMNLHFPLSFAFLVRGRFFYLPNHGLPRPPFFHPYSLECWDLRHEIALSVSA